MNKLRSADDLSDLDLGVFIVREKIVKLKQTLYQEAALSLPTHEMYGDAYDICIDKCDELLDIATLGDIASTKEQLNERN